MPIRSGGRHPDLRSRAITFVAVLALMTTACTSDGVSTGAAAPLEPAQPLEAATSTPGSAPTDGAAAATEAPTTVAPGTAALPTTALEPGAIELFRPEVLAAYPHDDTAFTQGLEIHEGQLLESTGRQGHPGGNEIFGSDLRRVDIETGAVLQLIDAPGDVFAEGLTRVGDELFQLTWRDEQAFTWDAATFERRREFRYQGEGWGLCYDGERLVMTDGSSTMFFRNPETFEILDRVQVTQRGQPVELLNELECVGDRVWANVWRTDLIVRIDPETGIIDGLVDASGLEQPRTPPTEVLNGIAWDDTTGTWLLTGKFWPTVYRVRLVSEGVIGG